MNNKFFLLALFLCCNLTVFGQIIQKDTLPTLFLEWNNPNAISLDINDYFEDVSSVPIQANVEKMTPGINLTFNSATISISPTANFLGKSQFKLSIFNGPQTIEKILDVHTQLPADFGENCNVKVVNIGIYNFDPLMPQYGNVPCHEAYNWNDPIELTEQYFESIHRISHGYIVLNLKHWVDINDWGVKSDGYQYDAFSYDNCISNGNCHNPDIIDYPAVIEEYGVDTMIQGLHFEEAWFWGGPAFGYWEASMAGFGAYFINGGVFPEVDTERPFAIMGFNYERQLAEMLHSNGHRAENHITRAYNGQWNSANPVNNWEFFSVSVGQSNSTPAVGNIHFPANGVADYDYANPQTVQSTALDYMNYPNLTGQTTPVNRETWGGPDYHLGYMEWWFELLPHVGSINMDNRMNNWWKYIYDYTNYKFGGETINTFPNISVNTLDFTLSASNTGLIYLFDYNDYITDAISSFPTLYTTEGFVIEGNSVYFYNSGEIGDYTGTIRGCDQEFLINIPIIVTVSEVTSNSNAQESDHSIHLFPNPTYDIVTVKFETNYEGQAEFTVLNMVGKVLQKTEHRIADNNQISLNLKAYPPGVYIIKVNDIWSEKVIKVE